VVERDELARSLALARQALQGPAAMKARVRAQLAAGGASAPLGGDAAPPAPRLRTSDAAEGTWLASGWRLLARRPQLATAAVTVLVGLSFGAGFWLGQHPNAAPLEAAGPAKPASSPAAARNADGAANAGSADGAATSGHADGAATAGRAVGAASPVEGTTHAADGSSGAEVEVAAEVKLEAAPTANVRRARATRARATELAPRGNVLQSSARRSSDAREDDALAEEIALLQRAERAIRAGEATLALALLGELDRRFPAPSLREERSAALVLAHCVQSRGDDAGSSQEREARARAERFLAEAPTSVYADRIRASCPLDTQRTNAPARSEEPIVGGH
jgi:hypothetical protein